MGEACGYGIRGLIKGLLQLRFQKKNRCDSWYEYAPRNRTGIIMNKDDKRGTLPLHTEALTFGLGHHGLGVHAVIDGVRGDLVAERVNRTLGVAQIVILVHLLIELMQTGS